MASRDLALRDAFHKQLEEYIQPLDEGEYQRFLGTEAEQIEQLMAKKAKSIHLLTIKHSSGGAGGIRDFGKIESLFAHIQNDDYYHTFVDKLTHLVFCVCKFHGFEDGNKRLAITLPVQFMPINGYLSVAQTFFRETENISYHVAAGQIDKDLLHDILGSIMRGDFEENEDVKFRYYTAIAEE